MTVVNTETGELVDFDPAAAERRAERIICRLDAIAENYSRVLPMIREAIEKRDDIALGYRSPGEYVSDRFGQSLAGLGIEVRRAVVGELTEAGLSTRAIAPVVGVSNKTVSLDRGVTQVTPPSSGSPQTSSALPEAHSQGDVQHEADEDEAAKVAATEPKGGRAQSSAEPLARPSVTGIDGKTYTRPAPARILKVAPTPDPAEWDEQDRAEELADNLARNISLTYALTNPERRAEYIANWKRGTISRPVLGQNFVTPKHMRDLAEALNTFATEWEQGNV